MTRRISKTCSGLFWKRAFPCILAIFSFDLLDIPNPSASALAQSIESVKIVGSVRRSDTTVLSGATISTLFDGSGATATSDSNGAYSLSIPGSVRQLIPYVVLRAAAAGYVSNYAIVGLEGDNPRADIILEPETPITYTTNFTGAFPSYTEPTIGCQFTTSITSGTITLKPTPNPDGTLKGTATVSLSLSAAPASFTVPGGSCGSGTSSANLSGTVAGTDSNITVTDLTNNAADRPYTATFTGTRSGSTISGSLAISRTFQTTYSGSVTGNFPRTTSVSNLALKGDRSVFSVEVDLDPALPTLDGIPYIQPIVPGAAPTDRNKTSIKVTTKKDGTPQALNFVLDVQADPHSNGHTHLASPRKIDLSAPLGFPILGETTGTGGEFRTELLAFDVAVDLTIIAKALPPANTSAGLTQTVISQPRQLRIAVPNLAPIGNVEKGQVPDPANYDITRIETHKDGFYGTSATIDYLADTVSVLKDIRSSGALECTLDQVLPLDIQAVSLRYGGFFDIDKNFLPPHAGHRLGREVDIGFRRGTMSEQCKEMLRWALEGAKYIVAPSDFQLFRVKGERPGDDGRAHWHVRVPTPAEQSPLQSLLTATPGAEVKTATPIAFALTQQSLGSKIIKSGTGLTSTFDYNYSVSNPNSSKNLELLKVGFSGAVASAAAPTGWLHAPMAKSGGWFWGAVGNAVISPGSQKTGFSIRSAAPPAIRPSLIDFVYNDPEFPDETVALDPSLLHADEAVKGFVLGPRNAGTFQPQAFLQDLIQMKAQAVSLGWIDNAGMSIVDAKLSAANTALAAGAGTDAWVLLGDLLLEIEGKKSFLRDEGYALLSLNAEYLRDRLPAPNNPVPTLASIDPNSANSDSSAVTITLTGTNFLPVSVVRLGTTALSTTYVSSTQLRAVIPAGNLVSVGTLSIDVINPAPGGGASQALSFAVLGPTAPMINEPSADPSGVNPAIAPYTGAPFALTVNGQRFVQGAVVSIAGSALSTTFVNSTQLTAGVTTSILAATGNFAVQVRNPNGETSNTVHLSVVNRGDINGDGRVNVGDALATALAAAGARKPPLPITVGDINVDGTANVGDALAIARIVGRAVPNFAVPVISSISPDPATRGGTLTITGSGFAPAASENQVMFAASNNTFARVVPESISGSAGNLSLLVKVPENAVSGIIAVNRLDAAIGGDPYAFLIADTPTPLVLANVAPNFQLAAGATITISGLGFDAVPANNIVSFRAASGTVNGTVIAATPTSLSVTVPPGALCGGITVATGGRTSNARSITVAGTACPLAVTDFIGNGDPGDFLMIDGAGFDTATPSRNIVTFAAAGGGTVAAPVLAAGRTRLHVRIPNSAVDGDVNVAGGIQTSNAIAYRRMNAPIVTSINPTRTPQNSSLTYTLTGSNFIAGATSVTVAGTGIVVSAVNVTSTASLAVKLSVDAGATLGSRALNVQTPSGTTAASLTVVGSPRITSLTLTSAVGGSTIGTLRINGSGFDLFPSRLIAFVPSNGTTPETKFVISNVSLVDAMTITLSVQVGTSSAPVAAGSYRVEVRDSLNSPSLSTQTTNVLGANVFSVTGSSESYSIPSEIVRVTHVFAGAGGDQSAVSDLVRVNSDPLSAATTVLSPEVRTVFVHAGALDSISTSSSLVRALSGVVSGNLESVSPVVSVNACPATVALGTNLVVNTGGEPDVGSSDNVSVGPAACWTTTGNFGTVRYGASSFPAPISGAGTNFFAGGPESATSSASQTINASGLASSIDAGTLKATLSALLGGKGAQADGMTITVTFKSASDASLGSLSIGPVTAADRSNATTLIFRSATASVPVLTRTIIVTMNATRLDDSYNDAYADNVSVVLASN